MAHRSPDGDVCPVCGQEYDQRVVVERGDGWSDVFAGTPLSFFRRYQRRCTSQFDVESDSKRPGSECVVYFHEGASGVSLF
ncbi:hypothetical protein BRC81_00675 [Halobacteriales archaeon QS_1_68_20]|nr:MAG: hypothetical protein BRC81_00675 [Halobacteriales archaeon QS_1_68_20]